MTSRRASIEGLDIARVLRASQDVTVAIATQRGPGGFERRVVVKRARLPRTGGVVTSMAWPVREAMAYARLEHPCIPRLYQFFAHGDDLVLVLEHVDGIDLAELLGRLRHAGRDLPLSAALYIAYRVFGALAAAHWAREPATGGFAPIVHRDVTPANVLVPWDGYVRLADFGTARVFDVPSDSQVGMLRGTPGYMAPEQVRGGPISARTDIYAACMVLAELLAGEQLLPREELDDVAYLERMAEGRFATRALGNLRRTASARVLNALARGLARDADRRNLSAAEMVEVLRAEISPESARAVLIDALRQVREGDGLSTSDDTSEDLTARGPRPPRIAPGRTSIDTVAAFAKSVQPPPPTRAPVREDDGSASGPHPTIRPWRRAATVVGALGAAAAIAMGTVALSPKTRRTATPVGVPTTAAVTAPSATAAPAPRLAPAPATSGAPPASQVADATTGELLTPIGARAHRVWVDGVVVGHSGRGFDVACGERRVRVGSKGVTQTVAVPCGGRVAIEAGGR